MKEYIQELERKDREGKRGFIKKMLKEFGTSFATQSFHAFPNKGENIIVDFSHHPATKKKICLTAHYDTFFGAPGANDNGSGVAVLLCLIKKIWKEKPASLKPVRFVFFDLEEWIPVGAGSRSYIKEYGVEDIDRVYNLEMVGMGEVLILWPATQQEVESGPLKSIRDNAERQSLDIVVMPHPRVNLITFPKKLGFASDHVPFVEKRCEAVSFTCVPQEDMARLSEVLKGKKTKQLLWDLAKYRIFGRGDIPKLLRHYHNKDDRSEFLEERTLRKIFNILCQEIFE